MKLPTSLIVALGAVSGSCIELRQSNWTVGQTVQTSSGPVQGHAASNATGVSTYLGIHFAQPPIGNLRFAPPQTFSGNTTINGTNYGFTCPASGLNTPTPNSKNVNLTAAGTAVLASYNQLSAVYSEDCLTLNVWTKPQTGDAQKAVLVWIYGGGYNSGWTASPNYDGQYISDQEDVILVSINYRVNILGFPGAPGIPNNLGLLDQRLGIEWVRDNIAAFGGDPSRITLFGQSAGATSIDYYTFAWQDDPIANAFIEESGSLFGATQYSAVDVAGLWFNTSATLGCGGTLSNSSEVLACMRTKNYTELTAAVPSAGSFGFGPAVDNVVVFEDYLARSSSGNFTRRPLLSGNNNNEAGLFQTFEDLAGNVMPQEYWDDYDLTSFTCPCAERANISVANNVPTWRYRWFGAFPDTVITTIPETGAWHTSELLSLFGVPLISPGVPPQTPAELAIGTYLRGAWAAFAKDPVNGLSSYGGGWPEYSPSGNTLIRLAYNNMTGPNLAGGASYDTGCKETFSLAAGSGRAGNSTKTESSTGSATSTGGCKN